MTLRAIVLWIICKPGYMTFTVTYVHILHRHNCHIMPDYLHYYRLLVKVYFFSRNNILDLIFCHSCHNSNCSNLNTHRHRTFEKVVLDRLNFLRIFIRLLNEFPHHNHKNKLLLCVGIFPLGIYPYSIMTFKQK